MSNTISINQVTAKNSVFAHGFSLMDFIPGY